MAKKRRKSKRRFPSHLRKYWFKKKGRKRSHRKAHKMARRRHRRSHRKHHHRRRRRRSGGGGGRGWMPGRDDLKLFAAGAVIGRAEAMAKADANFVLNKVPRPVVALGYTGGTAIALWAASKLIGGSIGSYARIGARAAAVAAAYQMGKAGGAFTSVSVQGWHDGGEEHYIDDHVMGALDAEGSMMGNPLPFDDTVHQMDT